MTNQCPRCTSPQPHLHPAIQVEGEVSICTHPFHLTITPQNMPSYRRAVLEKLRDAALEDTP